MSTLFGILAGLSFLGVFFGLAMPKLVRMKSGLKAGGLFALSAIVFSILYIVTVPPEPQTQVVVTPTFATSTPEGQIEEIADNAAKGMTNESNKTHMQNTLVTPDPAGGWDVMVSLNGDNNLNEILTEAGVENQIAQEMIALYTGTTTISKVTVDVSLPVTDKYGNVNNSSMYSATLDRATANKVNWKSADLQSILPNVWHTDYDLFSVESGS